jgi:hypothetical protein
MSFISKYSYYLNLLKEQPESSAIPDAQDAAAPDPNASKQLGANKPEAQQTTIPPEGYVNLVRLLAKALVMNIPATEIDTLLTGQEITKENAIEMQTALNKVLNDNEVKEDNPERLENPNFKKFINSINENNFMQKYNQLLSAMKKRSPYVQ